MSGTMKGVLFCPPTYFEVKDVKNPYMLSSEPVSKELAQEQWAKLRACFQQAGYRLATIDAVPGLEDMVFAANQVFVGEAPAVGRFIVPSTMRYSSRQREVSHYVEWFRARNYKVLALELPQGEYLEGHGDLLWHADISKVWAGFGFRSSRGGVEKFVQAMQSLAIRVVPLELTDPSFYHLDTCMAPLNSEAVMIYVGAFSEAALASIRQDCARVHEVQREDALRFACNGVVANGKYIAPHLSPGVREILEREGLEPLEVNTSEFEKSGGSCFCLKTFIF